MEEGSNYLQNSPLTWKVNPTTEERKHQIKVYAQEENKRKSIMQRIHAFQEWKFIS